MNTEKFKNLVNKSYSDWTQEDHDQGFKVTYSTYEGMDYDNMKSDNPDDWSYEVKQAKYQPKGYWGNVLTVEVSDKGVKFSRSSGGDIGDVDGLKQMEYFQDALRHAKTFAIAFNKKEADEAPMSTEDTIKHLMNNAEYQWNDKDYICLAFYGADDKPENVTSILKQCNVKKKDVTRLKKIGVVHEFFDDDMAVIVKMHYSRVLNATDFSEEYLANLG